MTTKAVDPKTNRFPADNDAAPGLARDRQASTQLCPARPLALTFLSALRSDHLAAPCVFDGPINGQCFRAYVKQQLTPILRPGDIFIIDNLGSHKSAEVRKIIKAAGVRLWFLPAYSPDLNPIEQAFAKIKHWMRHAQKRTIEDTWRQIGDLVSTINPNECCNYSATAGYASVKT